MWVGSSTPIWVHVHINVQYMPEHLSCTMMRVQKAPQLHQ